MLHLYLRHECHLCEQAMDLLQALRLADRVHCVDIDDDPELGARYGLLIPLLARTDGATLAWPFDADQLADFVGAR